MATPDGNPRRKEFKQDATRRRSVGDLIHWPKREWMVADNQICLLSDRLASNIGSQSQAGHYSVNGRPFAADQQADIIPVSRQLEWGELLEFGDHSRECWHKNQIIHWG
jgi:hypothetical protein